MEHKRGDSFDYKVAVPLIWADGHFSDWTVTAQVRNVKTGALVADLSTTWEDPETTRDLRLFHADTSAWPVANLEMDVQFTRDDDGYVISTNTVTFYVIPDVTRS